MSDQFWQVFAPALVATIPNILTSLSALILVIRGRRKQRTRLETIEGKVTELVDTVRERPFTEGGADSANDRPRRRRLEGGGTERRADP